MEKEQVVELMTKTIIDLNVEIANQNDVPQEQIDQMIEVTTPQMNQLNSIMYEVLKVNGVIA
jgi:transcriptional/translational regulatory protein YebC/TACO1